MRKVRSPTAFTAMPSAMVWPPMRWAKPRRRAVKEGYMAASTPKTSASGRIALTAVATPEIRPPPPMGTGKTSSSGASSSISSARVPWPAMTSKSLKGCTNTRPRSSHSRRAWASASS